jgi:hypothetical protein
MLLPTSGQVSRQEKRQDQSLAGQLVRQHRRSTGAHFLQCLTPGVMARAVIKAYFACRCRAIQRCKLSRLDRSLYQNASAGAYKTTHQGAACYRAVHVLLFAPLRCSFYSPHRRRRQGSAPHGLLFSVRLAPQTPRRAAFSSSLAEEAFPTRTQGFKARVYRAHRGSRCGRCGPPHQRRARQL